ncbi:hypothetical protein D3C79_822380 [compost metagenome]
MEPRLREPLQHGLAVRPTVDQVTHTEQAVYGRVETHRFKALFQALEVTMDIAHCKVTSPDIGE